MNILTIFSNLNPDWLLLGKGEMLRGGAEKTPAGGAEMLEIIKKQQETIGSFLAMVQEHDTLRKA